MFRAVCALFSSIIKKSYISVKKCTEYGATCLDLKVAKRMCNYASKQDG